MSVTVEFALAPLRLWRPAVHCDVGYGVTAADECQKVGLPLGVSVWPELAPSPVA